MATIEELEQQEPSNADKVLEALKKDFINEYSYAHNRTKCTEALERLLKHVKANR